ncbi:hypothetical protein MC7420_1020 [Coleofasciculus chthonoplastes PCC 7420]|uniref:Uncharacterized protein n=1 Tax=Coleofasciculus chthonoplastes PCC 7420 TaxID=118168 RepID=B4W0A6_9CYAN|nr:hypothetical protein MC7420_1020 [Coleofasciculus chthonoplastes PCC 7420]
MFSQRVGSVKFGGEFRGESFVSIQLVFPASGKTGLQPNCRPNCIVSIQLVFPASGK